MIRSRIFRFMIFGALVTELFFSGSVSTRILSALHQPNTSAAQAESVGPVGQNPADWVMTFNDEFDGTALDRVKWRTDYWNGGNGEMQEYVDDDSHNNYVEQNGVLNLIARQEYYMGKNYTSGSITTQDRFYQKYGYFEIRAKTPAGKGLWPAFWLMPNPNGWPPEIDVLENLGDQVSTAYLTLHYNGGQSQTIFTGPDFSADFHTFGVAWTADSMVWYVDGVAEKTYTNAANIPNVPMFILANLAVGGSWPGSPDASTAFPASYQIDYIRAWQSAGGTVPPPPPPPSDTTPPSVAITNPSNGGTVARKSTVTIAANASDDIGISKVEFRVNNTLVCSATASPYTCSWKVPGNQKASYQINATAYDLAGNTAVSSVTVKAGN